MSSPPGVLVLAALAALLGGQPLPPRDLGLRSSDGQRLYATLYTPLRPRALILLFHQAGSNRAEYAPIAPRLTRLGCAALAVDLRVGGNLGGVQNQTWAEAPGEDRFLAARPDLEGALGWALERWSGPLLVWGSSYTAGLVFDLAARHPQAVSGVLAFSPGEYFPEDPRWLERTALGVHAAVYLTSTPEEAPWARRILEALPGSDKRQFVPSRSHVHGSSVLRPDRTPAAGVEEAWNAVTPFLERFCGPPRSGDLQSRSRTGPG